MFNFNKDFLYKIGKNSIYAIFWIFIVAAVLFIYPSDDARMTISFIAFVLIAASVLVALLCCVCIIAIELNSDKEK
jgi:hypothetical protein